MMENDGCQRWYCVLDHNLEIALYVCVCVVCVPYLPVVQRIVNCLLFFVSFDIHRRRDFLSFVLFL